VLVIRRKAETIGALVQLAIAACVAFYQFAESGRWTFAALFGVVLPIAAAFDWRAQQAHGEEAGRTANRWLAMISFALLAAGL
jgi:uncharacterized membrane protein SirB2